MLYKDIHLFQSTPSLMSLMVSVDIKHHAYLLSNPRSPTLQLSNFRVFCCQRPGLSRDRATEIAIIVIIIAIVVVYCTNLFIMR